MVDPVTAFGLAVTAFNTVQKLVKAGKEIESVAGQLSKWYSAVQSFNESTAKKKNKKGKSSVEQEAFDVIVHRQKLKEMEYQLYILIAGTYGQEIYQSMMAERKRIRAERERQIRLAKKKKQEMIANGIYLFLILFILSLCYYVFDYILRNIP